MLLLGASLVNQRNWLSFLAGFVLLLSMATYQSMVLIGPALLLLVFLFLLTKEHVKAGQRLMACVPFLSGCFAGLAVVWGGAYYFSGSRGLIIILRRFLDVPAHDVYGQFSFLKIAAVPLGFTYALFPCLPHDCGGFRCLADPGREAWIAVAALSFFLAVGAVTTLGLLTLQMWKGLSSKTCTMIACCLAALVLDVAAVAYWMPTYDKLWLQPLALFFILCAVVGSEIRRTISPGAWFIKLLLVGGACFILIIMVWNLSLAAFDHFSPTPFLSQANKVAGMVSGDDLLVGDWNNIFVLYQYVWGARHNSFNVPTDSIRYGKLAIGRLESRIVDTQRIRGHVFFLGLLDVPRSNWYELVGRKGGLPYIAFDRYRECTRIVASFTSDHETVVLRVLNTSLSQCPR